MSFNDNKSVGRDNTPAYFLKIAKNEIAPYLIIFLNFIFLNGCFSDNCKIAKVAPIYRSGRKDKVTNYRPISILTCFSKIIENLICKRFVKFFKKMKRLIPINMDFTVTFPLFMLC